MIDPICAGSSGVAITLPLLTTDKAVVRGKEMAVLSIDDNTRRIQGVLVAYDIQVRG